MGSQKEPQIKKVAVIGAGAAGVTATKYLLAEQCYDTIDVYEQRDSFGGVWNYSSDDCDVQIAIPQTDPRQPLEVPTCSRSHADTARIKPRFSSPMYEGLETNIPDALMQHSDDHTLCHSQLFPSRETVLEYLANYAMKVKHCVRLSTQVTQITLRQESQQDEWVVLSQDLTTGVTQEVNYDAIVVANGHYNVPYLPDIRGIREWNLRYPGIISHSKFYRRPADFLGKKTMVVGYAASGIDITFQISTKAKLPILVSRRSVSYMAFPVPYIQDLPEIVEFLPASHSRRAVRFADGHIESDIDAILFCTGYFYSFPFLSSLKPPMIDTGERVAHLYKHIFSIRHPTLAFVGLPVRVIPFRTFEAQSAVVAKLWARRLELPSTEKMQKWEQEEIERQGSGRRFHVMDFPKDFDYHNELVTWGSQAHGLGKMPPKWAEQEYWTRERFPAIKRAFNDRHEQRHEIMEKEQLGFIFQG